MNEDCGGISTSCRSREAPGAIEAAAGQECANSGGDAPEEDPVELQTELEKSARELTLLIQRINRTNSSTAFGTGTLADSLAERDVLKIRYNAYRELANATSTSQGRLTRSEVKFISTVSVAAIQRKADDLAREYRELDTRIQEADWLTILLD